MAEQEQTPDAEDVVVQLLQVLSEVGLEGLGEDLRHLDDATTRRALTGASMLAEAITRAAFGSAAVSGALGVELDEAPPHVPLRSRGERVEVHDDGRGAAATDDGRGLGLTGMQERVAAHGGTLRTGPAAGGGFAVCARIPL